MVFGNGQWVRARNTAGVKGFLAEQELRSQQQRRRAQRWRELRQRLLRGIRGLFRSKR